MKTNNWREEFDRSWETSYGRLIYGESGFLTKDLGTPFTIDKELVKDFIQSLLDEKDKEKEEALDKQREEIILAISDSYINSIHTSNNEGARLWRNEIINKLINKIKEI